MSYDLNAEVSMLSAVMNKPKIIPEVYNILTSPKYFYDGTHKDMYQAVLELYHNNAEIDIVTILDKMRENGSKHESLTFYLNEVSDNNMFATNTKSHIQIILKHYRNRKMDEMVKKLRQIMKGEHTPEDVNKIINEYDHIRNMSPREEALDMRTIIMKDVKLLAELGDNPRDMGEEFGFNFDNIIRLQKGETYYIGSRPAMGKTSLAVKIAYNVAIRGKRVIYFTLETSKRQINHKLISITQNISDNNFKTLSSVKQAELQDNLYTTLHKTEAEYLVDDDSNTVDMVVSRAKKLHNEKPLDLVVIDHISLIGADRAHQNRNQELTVASRNLKMLAKNLDIPILILVQLNRGVESRENKIPMLSDIRESGAIEQDATGVFFLYRPEYYDIEEEDGEDTSGLAKLIIAKNRYGRTGLVKLNFEKHTTNFTDWIGEKAKWEN